MLQFCLIFPGKCLLVGFCVVVVVVVWGFLWLFHISDSCSHLTHFSLVSYAALSASFTFSVYICSVCIAIGPYSASALIPYIHIYIWDDSEGLNVPKCAHTHQFFPLDVCVCVFNFYLLSHLNVTCCAILCHNIMDTVMPCSSCSSGRTSFTLSGGACLAKSWCL